MVDDYDSPWKEAIERYFSDFLHFYFPYAHADIDWGQPLEFLEQELRSLSRDAGIGKRVVDKLVRVTLKNGSTKWVYIHLEVQGNVDDGFAERMFVYNYRLFDKYRLPIASLGVLADDRPNWRPIEYGYGALRCRMGIRFPIAKLSDWAGSETRLADSDNPFAVLTWAHLATRATRSDLDARLQQKLKIMKNLYRRGWDRKQVIDLFKVIDWMMWLPRQLDSEFRLQVDAMERKEDMRYVTSIERLAMEEGMEKGMHAGMQQGRIEGKRQVLVQLLARRFGQLPEWSKPRLALASEPELESWIDGALDADSIESVLGAAKN